MRHQQHRRRTFQKGTTSRASVLGKAAVFGVLVAVASVPLERPVKFALEWRR